MKEQKRKVINCTTIFLCFGLLSFTSCAHKSGHNKDRASRHRETVLSQRESQTEIARTERKVGGHTIVTMRKEGGVYFVPIIVNGLDLDFIFDTGASNISLSVAEAIVMSKQGKITEDDVVGQACYSDANGNISVGMVVLLRTVQIGDIILHNVEASIVDNIKAPLLLGQSALAKFGRVTIDYNKNTIEFN